MNAMISGGLPLGAAMVLLAGCASPVAEQSTCSPAVTAIQTEQLPYYNIFPRTYYGFSPPSQYLRGACTSVPLRYNLRTAAPAAVAERIDGRPEIVASGPERIVATETYGLWQ